MCDQTKRYHITFNGEIYNYLELREQLTLAGFTFDTDTDTEVLLKSYILWGPAGLSRLRGMFAFVVWDDLEKILFAARDRFGIKPLYYAHTGHGIAFSSEIKQLHGLPGLSARMNVARVHDFLASGISNHTAETMFSGICQLRGGESLRLDCKSKDMRPEVYRWYPVDRGELILSEDEAADKFCRLLTESVRIHLRSDVRVGSCLSGGLDSSSLVCLMSQMLGGTGQRSTVHTISACYAEKSVDEKPFMDAVIHRTKASPHFVYPRTDDLESKVSDLTWHQDEPFGSTSIFAQWAVFEEAKKQGIKVMLDGQGADEQLAGYHGSFYYYIKGLIARKRQLSLIRTIIERKAFHGLSIADQVRSIMLEVSPTKLPRWLAKPSMQVDPRPWLDGDAIRSRGNKKGAVALAEELLGLRPAHDIASLCMTLTFGSNLAMLLHFEDRNSMAHSVEARVPFLDHPIVEFSLAMGNEHKIVGGDTKRVLRRAMKDLLPKEVLHRRDKLGFSTPEQVWLQGPLRGMVESGVETTLKLYPDLFNADETRAYSREILDGVRPFETSLWRIVNLGVWGQRFNVSL